MAGSRCLYINAIGLAVLLSLGSVYCVWPASPMHAVMSSANSSDLIVIGTVTAKTPPTTGGNSHYNATLEVERVIKGRCWGEVLVRASVKPNKTCLSNPRLMVGDRVFLLLFEYPTSHCEPGDKLYRLGGSYIWIIERGTIYNRCERWMKENLNAPSGVTDTYGWEYSLGEFLELVSTAISRPEKADPYSLKPLPTRKTSILAIALLISLPSISIATIAIYNQRHIQRGRREK